MLSVKNISKSYVDHKALDNISLNVRKSSIFGLLGPNGAGKTSLIRIINQIINQDEGEIYLEDRPITYDDVRKIGYMPEERGLYKKRNNFPPLSYIYNSFFSINCIYNLFTCFFQRCYPEQFIFIPH